jgi:methyl-accepting chemotaxis protein
MMLRRGFYSLIGILLIAAALAGLVISVVGIVGIWRVEQSLSVGLEDTLDLLDTTLETTDDGLEIAGKSLDQAAESFSSLAGVLQTTGKTVRGSIPLLDSISKTTTQEIPAVIERTQAALESAQSSAKFVDATLRLLTAIPFLTIERYDPEVSLADALGEASATLDPISESLSQMNESVSDSATNLSAIAEQLDTMAVNVKAIKGSLTEAKQVTTQYLEVVSTLRQQLDQARGTLPGQLEAIAWFVTVALVWLGLTQVGLMMQGLEMMGLSFLRPDNPPR